MLKYVLGYVAQHQVYEEVRVKVNVKWLRCRARKGMFSDELVVQIQTKNGEQEFFVVPKTEVQIKNDQDGQVRVQLIDSGGIFAVMPNDDRAVVPVDKGEIVAA